MLWQSVQQQQTARSSAIFESQKPAKNEVWAITSACCLFHIDINGCLWARGISMFTLPILPCYWPTQCAMSHSLFTLFIYNLPPFLSQKKCHHPKDKQWLITPQKKKYVALQIQNAYSSAGLVSNFLWPAIQNHGKYLLKRLLKSVKQ